MAPNRCVTLCYLAAGISFWLSLGIESHPGPNYAPCHRCLSYQKIFAVPELVVAKNHFLLHLHGDTTQVWWQDYKKKIAWQDKTHNQHFHWYDNENKEWAELVQHCDPVFSGFVNKHKGSTVKGMMNSSIVTISPSLITLYLFSCLCKLSYYNLDYVIMQHQLGQQWKSSWFFERPAPAPKYNQFLLVEKSILEHIV